MSKELYLKKNIYLVPSQDEPTWYLERRTPGNRATSQSFQTRGAAAQALDTGRVEWKKKNG